VRIEWDPAKSAANLRKHGVSFEEAAELLASHTGFLGIYDEAHSEDEDRFIAIGWIDTRLIVVIYTEPEDQVARIISARKATKIERGRYEDFEEARFR
jgi:uncharacterized DUF497 family protein